MTGNDTEQVLRTLLADFSGHDTAALALGDDIVDALGLDSLAGLRLLAAVERRFDARFPDDRLSEFRTLRSLLEVIGQGAAP